MQIPLEIIERTKEEENQKAVVVMENHSVIIPKLVQMMIAVIHMTTAKWT